ncbi:hypothetical protein VNO77_20152 [Canavalia gladiata]|uniref:Uncharacterized protein n=1 Tax=Canavalia gladiata TaxID=3824 RepID=A0AAN9LP40_CANGL
MQVKKGFLGVDRFFGEKIGKRKLSVLTLQIPVGEDSSSSVLPRREEEIQKAGLVPLITLLDNARVKECLKWCFFKMVERTTPKIFNTANVFVPNGPGGG